MINFRGSIGFKSYDKSVLQNTLVVFLLAIFLLATLLIWIPPQTSHAAGEVARASINGGSTWNSYSTFNEAATFALTGTTPSNCIVELLDNTTQSAQVTVASGKGFTLRSKTESGGAIPNIYTLTSTIGSGYLFSNAGNVTLKGIVIDGSNASQHFNNSGALTMEQDSILTKGKNYGEGGGEGGAVLNSGTFTMNSNSKLTSCNGGTYGGAVSNYGPMVMNDNAEVSGNTASQGGGILVETGALTMNGNSRVINNTTTSGLGGGVYMYNSATKVYLNGNARISDNYYGSSKNNFYIKNSGNMVVQSTLGSNASIGICGAVSATVGAVIGTVSSTAVSGINKIVSDANATMIAAKSGSNIVWQQLNDRVNYSAAQSALTNDPISTTEYLTGNKKIKVDPNGGTFDGSTAAKTITVSGAYDLASATHASKVFRGWKVTADSSNAVELVFTAQYLDAVTVTYKDETGASKTTKIGKGSKITVDPAGGTWNGSSTSQQVTVSSNYNLSVNPIRTSYIFKGWRLNDSTGSVVFAAVWDAPDTQDDTHVVRVSNQGGASGSWRYFTNIGDALSFASGSSTGSCIVEVLKNINISQKLDLSGKSLTLRSNSDGSQVYTLKRTFAGSNYPEMIYANKSLKIEKIVIDGNSSAGNQGTGICMEGDYLNSHPLLTLGEGAVVKNHSDPNYGGGIYAFYSHVLMEGNASVTGNKAGYGGGIAFEGTSVILTDTASVSGNTATNTGGGIYEISDMYHSTSAVPRVSLSNLAKVTGNSASTAGGIYVGSKGIFAISDNAKVSGNSASATNGGKNVYMERPQLALGGYLGAQADIGLTVANNRPATEGTVIGVAIDANTTGVERIKSDTASGLVAELDGTIVRWKLSGDWLYYRDASSGNQTSVQLTNATRKNVNIKPNGGAYEGVTETTVIRVRGKYAVSDDIKRNGYVFKGWTCTNSSEEGAAYDLTAQWVIANAPVRYLDALTNTQKTVMVNSGGVISVDPAGGTYNSSTSVTTVTVPSGGTSLASPTMSGYTFTGWIVSEGSGSNVYTFKATYKNGSSTYNSSTHVVRISDNGGAAWTYYSNLTDAFKDLVGVSRETSIVEPIKDINQTSGLWIAGKSFTFRSDTDTSRNPTKRAYTIKRMYNGDSMFMITGDTTLTSSGTYDSTGDKPLNIENQYIAKIYQGPRAKTHFSNITIDGNRNTYSCYSGFYSPDGGGAFDITRGADLTLGKDAKLINHSVSGGEDDEGGAVCVRSDGIFDWLKGGSTFTMTDNAEISNCYARHWGGGVVCYGTMYMKDSSVVSNCSVSMSENTGQSGSGSAGGICLHNGSLYLQDNAKVTGNRARHSGGGINTYLNVDRVYASGGVIVDGNTSQDGRNNLCGDNNECIKMMGSLTGSSRIGVSVSNQRGVEGERFGLIDGTYFTGLDHIYCDLDTSLAAAIHPTERNDFGDRRLVWGAASLKYKDYVTHKQETEKMPIGTKVRIDPNGGVSDGHTQPYYRVINENDEILANATRSGYQNFPGWRKTYNEEYQNENDPMWIFTAVWDYEARVSNNAGATWSDPMLLMDAYEYADGNSKDTCIIELLIPEVIQPRPSNTSSKSFTIRSDTDRSAGRNPNADEYKIIRGYRGDTLINGEDIVVEDIVIDGNKSTYSATGNGGGISASSSLTVKGNALIQNHTTTGNGGGIYIPSGASAIFAGNASITANSASDGGGVAAESGSTVYLKDSVRITGNAATRDYDGNTHSNNLFVKNRTSITMAGNLSSSAKIGLSVAGDIPAVQWQNFGVTQSRSYTGVTAFKSDTTPNLAPALRDSGTYLYWKGVNIVPTYLGHGTGWVSFMCLIAVFGFGYLWRNRKRLLGALLEKRQSVASANHADDR